MASNLYPPIVDTYNPAFEAYHGVRVNENGQEYTVRKGYCNIYFYLSPYNQKKDIKSIWISIVNATTNKTVLEKATEVYKADISQMKLDPTSPPENPRYYIRLGAFYLKGKTWDIDTLYKIQVRFCGEAINEKGEAVDVKNTSSDINKYIDSFSEWSTATLVKPIPDYSTSFNKIGKHQSGSYYEFNNYQNLISGTVSYKDKTYDLDNGEYLESFRIKIYSADVNWITQALIYDSGICYANDLTPNVFEHKLTQGLEQNINYIFHFAFTSNNLFKHTRELKVRVKDRSQKGMAAKISATPEPENGRMKLIVTTPAGRDFYAGNFIIRRSSSESNFNYWEDFKIIQINDSNKSSKTQHTFYDYTVDSGIFYQYHFSKLYKTGETEYDALTEQKLMILEDMFINGEGRQLKIKFDPSISSYQHTLSESSIQTIGGKYPFIKRNGNLNYRQIGISGLLSYQMDILEGYDDIIDSCDKKYSMKGIDENLFTSKESLYNGYKEEYEQFNINNRILPEKDFILERKFREEVTNFLLNGQPKLFRSPTEKAGIVRLMNVSVTPNAGLGRMLYSFSTTAHEIADCTLDNIAKYKINEQGGFQQIIGKTLNASQASLSTSINGPVDYYTEQVTNMKNVLDGFVLTPSNMSVYNAQISYFYNTQISLFQNSAMTTSASPYAISGATSNEPILADGDEQDPTQGFILYYEIYNPEMGPVLQALSITESTYTFTSDMPITFLSYAVPSGRTIYAKITSNITGYETVKDEGVGETGGK